jgi:hypothetical protein
MKFLSCYRLQVRCFDSPSFSWTEEEREKYRNFDEYEDTENHELLYINLNNVKYIKSLFSDINGYAIIQVFFVDDSFYYLICTQKDFIHQVISGGY